MLIINFKTFKKWYCKSVFYYMFNIIYLFNVSYIEIHHSNKSKKQEASLNFPCFQKTSRAMEKPNRLMPVVN